MLPKNPDCVDNQDVDDDRRKDAQNKSLAKKLHDARYIYAMYGLLDAPSMPYSIIKCVFDMLFTKSELSPADEMHDWLISPEGIIIAASSTIALIALSTLGNYFDDDDENNFKKYIAIFWPYIRDTLKGLKNAYKGVRSVFLLLELFNGKDLNAFVTPIGLLLGGLSVANRIWYRNMVWNRKQMMKANDDILKAIQNSTEALTLEILNNYEIKTQDKREEKLAIASAIYASFVDALYWYVGVFGLCSFAPPVLITLAVLSTVYLVVCILTRIYEEYDYQRKLHVSEVQAELSLLAKKIELLSDETLLNEAKITYQKKLIKLQELMTVSYLSAALNGAKNGLYAYGASCTIVFTVAAILSLASVGFPPALIITVVPLGLIFLMGFMAHSMYKARQMQALQISKEELEKDAVFAEEITILAPLQFYWQDLCEIIRTKFSALSKGFKFILFTMNAYLEANAKGHYQETSLMLGLMVISALIYAVIFSLRAYARGFGKDGLGATDNFIIKITPSVSETPEALPSVTELPTPTPPESEETPQPAPEQSQVSPPEPEQESTAQESEPTAPQQSALSEQSQEPSPPEQVQGSSPPEQVQEPSLSEQVQESTRLEQVQESTQEALPEQAQESTPKPTPLTSTLQPKSVELEGTPRVVMSVSSKKPEEISTPNSSNSSPKASRVKFFNTPPLQANPAQTNPALVPVH